MAEYEFLCKECGESFSLFEKIGQLIVERIQCPNCGSGSLQRLWLPIGVIYKGSGWTRKVDDKQ